jgi:hypothetical protein
MLGVRWVVLAPWGEREDKVGAHRPGVHRGEELPPVELYKIGRSYFALDGNHRVSVARYQGVEWIDAVVREFRVPLPDGRNRIRAGQPQNRSNDDARNVRSRDLEAVSLGETA